MYRRYVKRFLDIVFSLIAIVVLGLPMLAVAFLVRVKLGVPVIFKQKRIGRGNREFLLLKFRTMTEERDENGVYLPDADRTTPFGKFLRRTSIDELPSLINIIRGEMSIIGPRPLPVRYLPRYTKEELRRHTVRPGLSNVSVINGRNSQSWKDQFKSDVWYVDHMNFRLDVKSVIDTVKIVITKEGATSVDGDSRCEFIGTADVADLNDDDCNYIKIQQ